MKKNSFSIAVMQLALSIKYNAQLSYFFRRAVKPHVPVTSSIARQLISDYMRWEVEDEGCAIVPMDFRFKHDRELCKGKC